MVGRIPHYTALLLLFSLFLALPVHAQPGPDDRTPRSSSSPTSQAEDKKKAAALFDRAVHKFVNGRYDEAARLFLEADAAWPNSGALRNAIAAAQRAKNALLTAQAAQRALSRRDVDARTVRSAHEALAVVTPRLSRLDLECDDETCHIEVDGTPQERGVAYVLPGTHEVVGETARGTQVVHHVDCVAGAICQVTLRPVDDSAGVTAAPVVAEVLPVAPTPPPVTHRAAPPAAPRDSSAWSSSPRWMPLSALVASSAGTALFAALTTWSGADALAAKRLHKTDPEAYDPDDVRRRGRRTDYLLSGAILFTGATIVSTLWWVRWKRGSRASVALVPGNGAALVAEGRF
jgi:hypothetical protein